MTAALAPLGAAFNAMSRAVRDRVSKLTWEHPAFDLRNLVAHPLKPPAPR